MKNNKIISTLYVVGLLLFTMGMYADPTIVAPNGIIHLQILDSNLQPIYVSNFSNLQSQVNAGKEVQFTASTREFTANGAAVGGLQTGNALGQVNGKYKAQYELQANSGWKSLAFDTHFYVAKQQVGAVPGATSASGSAGTSVTVDLGSGEKVTDIDLGFEFSFGGDTYFSTNSIASLPSGSSYITAINTAVAAGKTVYIKSNMVKKSGTGGVSVWGASIDVQSKGTSILPGGSLIKIDELKAISMMGGGTTKTPVLHQATLTEKSVGYVTNNMKSLVMVSKVGSFALTLNSDITVSVSGGGPSNDAGTGTATGLTGKLKALGNNPAQSAVVSAIHAYATAQSITLNPTTWTGVISPALTSANLSSMASSIKTALNIGEESLKDKLTALGNNPSTSDVESTIKNYYHNNSSTIRSEWSSSITNALTEAHLSSKIAALKPLLDKRIKTVSGESAGGRF